MILEPDNALARSATAQQAGGEPRYHAKSRSKGHVGSKLFRCTENLWLPVRRGEQFASLQVDDGTYVRMVDLCFTNAVLLG